MCVDLERRYASRGRSGTRGCQGQVELAGVVGEGCEELDGESVGGSMVCGVRIWATRERRRRVDGHGRHDTARTRRRQRREET